MARYIDAETFENEMYYESNDFCSYGKKVKYK